MKQNKDKYDHVVVTIDGYEVTSHITRIQGDQENDSSKSKAQSSRRSRFESFD